MQTSSIVKTVHVKVTIYRMGRGIPSETLVGVTWIWMIHHVALLPSQFCEIPISTHRIGQTM